MHFTLDVFVRKRMGVLFNTLNIKNEDKGVHVNEV